jgi:probable F420-dependent oxidoreductase
MAGAQCPFRFGVQITRSRTGEGWRAAARRAEELGFDVFLMADHFGNQLSIGPALASVAEATSTIRIGTLVWQNDLRHPAITAMEAATLDVLSSGRMEVGIGAGGSFPPEFPWTGIPLDPPAVRVSRLAETLPVLKQIWANDPFSFSGEHFTFQEYTGHPKPVQQPHPPILMGAGGPRMLKLAAEYADIIGLLPAMLPEGGFDDGISDDAFAAKVETIRAHAGERFADIELNMLVQMFGVTDDREADIERRRIEMGIEPDDMSWFDSPMVYIGSVEQIAERMIEVREKIGISYFAVFEPMMEEFAPVIQALNGR